MTTRHVGLAAAAVLALTVTGCGSEDGGSAEKSSASPSKAAASSSAEDAGASAEVKVDTVSGKKVLTDGEGKALYLFTKDKKNTSACTDACLKAWPPLTGPAEAGKGVDASKLGKLTRPDGSIQASYAGKPLYYFAKDKAAGEGKGQGVKGVWFFLGADGQVVK